MKKLKYDYWLDSISKKVAFAAVLFLLYCCSPKLLPPTESDAERAKTSWSGSSLASLQQGHTLYINKCGGCHNLKLPQSENEDSWRKIVPNMSKKARLSSDEQDLILHYVLAMREAKK